MCVWNRSHSFKIVQFHRVKVGGGFISLQDNDPEHKILMCIKYSRRKGKQWWRSGSRDPPFSITVIWIPWTFVGLLKGRGTSTHPPTGMTFSVRSASADGVMARKQSEIYARKRLGEGSAQSNDVSLAACFKEYFVEGVVPTLQLAFMKPSKCRASSQWLQHH